MSTYKTQVLEPKVYEIIEQEVYESIGFGEPKKIKRTVFQPIIPRFSVPEKIYGEYEENVLYMFTYFQMSNENMGCLFHGEAGAGKSLTAELMCNKAIDAGMPVVYVRGVVDTQDQKNVEKYIELFKTFQGVCVYIDEFGKIFNIMAQNKFLSILTDSSKKNLWILTENLESSISKFIARRPGRVRYNIEFNKITERAVIEYCEDHPIPPIVYRELMDKYHSTDLFTFDQLKTIVSEVNFYQKVYNRIPCIEELCSRLNVRDVLTTYVFKLKDVYYLGTKLDRDTPRCRGIECLIDFNSSKIWDSKTIPVTMRDMNKILGGPSKELRFYLKLDKKTWELFTEQDIGKQLISLKDHMESEFSSYYKHTFSDVRTITEEVDGKLRRFVCCENEYFKLVYSVYTKSGEEVFFDNN